MTDREKGARFEQQIAQVLVSEGYESFTNQYREGRSGATHEIDVIGRKSDGIATTEILIECKAWEHPVDKDVVFKFSGVLTDLGVRGGVIAALSGFRSGAETMANELGITLWDRDEIDRRLGRATTASLSLRAPTHEAVGFPRTLSAADAQTLVSGATRGVLGKESIVWSEDLWLPIAYLQIALTRKGGLLKKTNQTTRIWNAYDRVSGNLLRSRQQPHEGASVDIRGRLITPSVKITQAERDINGAVRKLRSVSSEAAIRRHTPAVLNLGIPTDRQVVVESAKEFVFPVHVAIAQRRQAERLIVVDAFGGKVHEGLTASLTPYVGRIRESFG